MASLASGPPRSGGDRRTLAAKLSRALDPAESDHGIRTTNPQLTSTFQRTVDEGHARLTRSWPTLLATGAVGGADICVGVFAYYVVVTGTHSHLLGALAFSVGFIAITLSSSELFTENFLVPVAAVVAKDATVLGLLRLWVATLVTNLVAAWVIMLLIITGFPALHGAALSMAHHASTQRFNMASVSNAIVAGAVITLMTWMERSTESVTGKLAAAVMTGFLLVGGLMNHSIVGSVEMFGALHVGASFGYLRWLDFLAVATVGNLVGGLLLVTLLRLVQVGKAAIRHEQARDPRQPRREDEAQLPALNADQET